MHGGGSKQAIHAATELALQLEEFTPATKEAGQLLRRALEGPCGIVFGRPRGVRLRGDLRQRSPEHVENGEQPGGVSGQHRREGGGPSPLPLGQRWPFEAAPWRISINISRPRLGPTHPYTLDSIYNLGSFLLYDQQLSEAKQAFTEARDGCVECFGPLGAKGNQRKSKGFDGSGGSIKALWTARSAWWTSCRPGLHVEKSQRTLSRFRYNIDHMIYNTTLQYILFIPARLFAL